MTPSTIEDILAWEEELDYSEPEPYEGEADLQDGGLPATTPVHDMTKQLTTPTPMAPYKPPLSIWGVHNTVFATADAQDAALRLDFGEEATTMYIDYLGYKINGPPPPTPTPQQPSPPPNQPPSRYGPDQDLKRLRDDIQAAIWATSKRPAATATTKRQRLNPARRRWLKENNACCFCTSLDHIIDNCPNTRRPKQ